MAKSPEEMAQTMINNLKAKTGKSLSEWLKVLKPESFEKHGQIMKFLKGEHGITHGFANLIATGFLRGEDSLVPTKADCDDLVSAQYSGAKAELKPIYDAIIAAVQKFGCDVIVSPKKAYVSLRRNKQFAIIQPTTKTRIDVGINLKEVQAEGRLEKAGSFNAMVSHRVKLSEIKEVDAKLKNWLKLAYQQA